MATFKNERAFIKGFTRAIISGSTFSYDTDMDTGTVTNAKDFITIAKETDGYIVLHTTAPNGITAHIHMENINGLVECFDHSSHALNDEYFDEYLAN